MNNNKKVKDDTILTLNPRLVAIYELLRGFKLSESKALVLSTDLFKKLPPESQVASKREVDDMIKRRESK